MFGFRRGGVPLFVPILVAVAFGYLLAGGGSLIGAVLFLPFLIFKMMAMFFLFGMVFRFAGAGRPGGWRFGGWPHHHRPDRAATPPTEPEQDEAERDWEEALRAAKREIDKLFPNPKE